MIKAPDLSTEHQNSPSDNKPQIKKQSSEPECQPNCETTNKKTIKRPLHSHAPCEKNPYNQKIDDIIKILIEKCTRIMSLIGDDCSEGSFGIHHGYGLGCLSEFLDTIMSKLHRSRDIYKEIEESLQKQESINRNLIKKELEMREEHQCLIQQLNEQNETTKKLQKIVEKLSEENKDKDLEILQIRNELKASQREKFNSSQNYHHQLKDLAALKELKEEFKELDIDDADIYYVKGNHRNGNAINGKEKNGYLYRYQRQANSHKDNYEPNLSEHCTNKFEEGNEDKKIISHMSKQLERKNQPKDSQKKRTVDLAHKRRRSEDRNNSRKNSKNEISKRKHKK